MSHSTKRCLLDTARYWMLIIKRKRLFQLIAPIARVLALRWVVNKLFYFFS